MTKQMAEYSSAICDLFHKKINLLVVDDEPSVVEVFKEAFSSPICNVTAITSFSEAKRALAEGRRSWHCWIIDVMLDGHTGFELLHQQPGFPFVYFMTGIPSTSVGADGIKHGGIYVFEKGTDSVEYIIGEVARTAALGFIIDGKPTTALDTYKLLCDEQITTPEQWAEMNQTTLRQLHRICTKYSPLKAQGCLSLFRALSYAMRRPTMEGAAARRIDGWHPCPKLQDHYMECMKYVLERDGWKLLREGQPVK